MSDFVNTIDLLGDDVVIDSIIERTITEFRDDVITKIGYAAFHSCYELESVDVPNVAGIVDEYAFNNCISLRNVNMPRVNQIHESTFAGCTSLEKLVLPSLTVLSSNWGMSDCVNLRIADLGFTNRVSMGTFSNCHSLVAVVLRRDTVIDGYYMTVGVWSSTMTNCYHFHGTVNKEYNPDGLSDGYFYVPSAIIEDYKVATNWCNFADQFRALEDYTVDGTTTGALDETKI